MLVKEEIEKHMDHLDHRTEFARPPWINDDSVIASPAESPGYNDKPQTLPASVLLHDNHDIVEHDGSPPESASADAQTVRQAALDRVEGNALFPVDLMESLRVADAQWADDSAPPLRCRCGSSEFREIPIRGGNSSRRDCAMCDRFVSFPEWDGTDADEWPKPSREIIATPPQFCTCSTVVLPGSPARKDGLCLRCWLHGHS